MVVYGGLDNNGSPLGDVYRLYYSGTTLLWGDVTTSGAAPPPRCRHTAIYDESTVLINGTPTAVKRMIVFGGTSAPGQTPTDANVYELRFTSPSTAQWSVMTQTNLGYGAPSPRYGHSLDLDPTLRTYASDTTGHAAFLFGGALGNGAYSSDLWTLWLFQDGKYGWKPATSGGAPSARARHSATFTNNQGHGSGGGRLYVFGGENNSGPADKGMYVLDPWVQGASWSSPPWQAAATSLSGHSAVLDAVEVTARIQEVFDPTSQSPWLACTSAPFYWQHSYPLNFAVPGGTGAGGRLLTVGQDARAYYLDLPAAGQQPSSVWQTFSGLYTGIFPQSAVMYRPGRIMIAGGWSGGAIGDTRKLDALNLSAGWTASQSMHPRQNHNLVLTPDGKVLALGGEDSLSHSNRFPVKRPQIWDPDANSGQGTWTALTDLAVQPTVRGYHSTALLLPDGRVLSSGGEADPGDQPAYTDKHLADLFCPPYLFKADGTTLAARPVISGAGAPASLAWGKVFTICPPDPSHVTRVCMIRPGATTHSFDENQRYVPLSFSVASNPSRLLVTAPTSPDLAPPGYYMLFLTGSIDGTDVPSIASWVRLNSPGGRDTCDAVGPDAINDLAGGCLDDPGPGGGHFVITWSAPGDDGILTASGAAKEFDLRMSTTPITTDVAFNAATVVTGLPVPGVYGTNHQVTLQLGAGTYYFRIKTRDDNEQLSAMSNQLTLVVPSGQYFCESGFYGGSGGGGGFSMQRVAGSSSMQATTRSAYSSPFVENSLLGGTEPDVKATDILRLAAPTVLGNGAVQVRLRTRGTRRVTVDRVRLMLADRATDGAVLAIFDGVVLGTRTPATRVLSSDGIDITTALDGTTGYSAAAGEVLAVDLGSSATDSGAPLVIEAASGSTAGLPDSSGILIQASDGNGGWKTVDHIHPRESIDAIALDGFIGTTLRLQVLSPQTLNFVGRLVAAAETPTVQWATLTSAQAAGLTDRTSLIASADTLSATMSGADTLTLAFAAPALAEGRTRDYFLVVDATPLSTRGTAVSRSAPATPILPAAFALRQNQPNPFSRTTTIRFELPVGSMVRMDVFDAQGRRVRMLASRFFTAGYHAIDWDHSSDDGERMGPGVYFYRVEAGPFRDRKKMVLLAN